MQVALHTEIDRVIQSFDKIVAAIGITGEVRLSHADDDRVRLDLIGVDGGQRQKQDVAAGRKDAGQTVGRVLVARYRNVVAGEAADRQRIKQAGVDHFMRPRAQLHHQLTGDGDFRPMTLAIVEGDSMDFVVLI